MTKAQTANRSAPGDIIVAPSILSADFARLGEEVARDRRRRRRLDPCGCDGRPFRAQHHHRPDVVKALRPHAKIPFDVHLMIAPVDPFLEAFADAGADIITVHPEAGPHLIAPCSSSAGWASKAGVCSIPATPLELRSTGAGPGGSHPGDDGQSRLRRPELHRRRSSRRSGNIRRMIGSRTLSSLRSMAASMPTPCPS